MSSVIFTKKVPSKLLMIGDGPERQPAETLARELGVNDAVRFLGKLEAVEEVLSVADLFLMPSEKESFGLAALEAMACEVPVISSNSGGLPEVNIHGETGFMSDAGNVNEMARYAIHLLQNEEMLARFRTNALAQARRFDIENVLPDYEAYYEEVLVGGDLVGQGLLGRVDVLVHEAQQLRLQGLGAGE